MKLSNRAAIFTLPLALIGCAHSAKDAPFDVVIHGQASTCSVSVNGRVVTYDELLVIARKEAASRKDVIIDAGISDTPYRCIGGTIYALQRAGFSIVSFARDSPFEGEASNVR